MAGFVWGQGGEQLTPEMVARKRIAAELLRRDAGATTPVASPFAGINRALQGYLSGRDMKRSDTAESEGLASADAAIAALLGGQGGGYTASSSGGGYAPPSGSWAPAAPPPSPVDVATQGASGGLSFPGLPSADTGVAQGGGDFGAAVMTPQEMLIEGAKRRGLDPIDVATAISYETGGKFDPTIKGPTTQWGTHEGLIQFGDPQGQEHGAVFDQGPEAAWRSQLNPDTGAVWSYLDSVGVKPGMGLPEIYSGINAGAVGRMNASDANNGGAPGTVADKVAGMAPHREKAAAFLGGTWTPDPNAAVTASTSGGAPASSGSYGGTDIASLLALQANPWVTQKYGGVVDALMGQQFNRQDAMWEQEQRMNDPMYQAELEMAQLELDRARNPGAPAPIEVGGVLVDPLTYETVFDSRTPDPVDPFAGTKIIGNQLVAPDGKGGFAPVYTPPPDTPDAPTTKNVTLADGSEVMVQWNPATQVWDAAPIPQGGTGGTGQPAKLTEGQAKLKLFETMQTETSPVLLQLESQFDPSNLSDPSLAKIPIAGNYFTSADYQKYNAAAAVWAESALRIASGANAPEAEVQRNVETYFAQPGDTPETVAFKAQLRAMYGRAISAAQGNPSTGETLKLPTPTEFADEVAAGGGMPVTDLPSEPAAETPPPTFVSNPTIKATAEANGVTVEELWQNMSPSARAKFGG